MQIKRLLSFFLVICVVQASGRLNATPAVAARQTASDDDYFDNRIASATESRVAVHLEECRGDLAILRIENHASIPLYARFEKAPSTWGEYRKAKAQVGVFWIAFRPAGGEHYLNHSLVWDAQPNFRRIPPGGVARYGIYTKWLEREDGGELRIGISAMFDSAAVKLLTHDWPDLTDEQNQRIDQAWFDVWSAPIDGPCPPSAAN